MTAIRRILKIPVFWVAIILILVTGSCGAQNVDPVIEEIRLKTGELGANILIWDESQGTLPEGWEIITQRGIIKSQDNGDEPLLSFIVTYGHFSELGDLSQAWSALRYIEHPKPAYDNQNDFSDFAEGSDSGYVRFIKDRMIVSISFGRSRNLEKLAAADEKYYFSLVRNKIVQKIESQNLTNLPPFSVVYSKSRNSYPFTVLGDVNSEFEFEAHASAVNTETGENLALSTEANDNELNVNVTGLSPGRYDLAIWTQDKLGRESRFFDSFEVKEGSTGLLNPEKDTVLTQNFSHQNEGFNSLLTLEKVGGKATRENLGSKVSFYSKEGAAAAGDPNLAPRLLLEFGSLVRVRV